MYVATQNIRQAHRQSKCVDTTSMNKERMFCPAQWMQSQTISHLLDNKEGWAFQWGSVGWEAKALKKKKRLRW